MTKGDEELIQRLLRENEEFRRRMEEHQMFEKKLDEFNKRPFLTSQEEVEKKKIQKLKLAGKDVMELILSRYRDPRRSEGYEK